MNRRYFLLLLVLTLTLAACAGAKKNPADHVFSHRGASGEETEHTYAAYDLAIAYGTKYLELDLVLSAEGTLYVSHDDSPVRLDGSTEPYLSRTDAQIDALRTPDGQVVPRMTDVLTRYGSSVTYVAELKLGMPQVDAFIATVQASGLADHIIVQSWDLAVLERLEEVFPEMPKLYLAAGQQQLESALNSPCVDILSVNTLLMTSENCAMVHKAGKQFNVWTLNSVEEIKTAIALGVDSYFTDYTAKALLLEATYRGDADD